MLSIGGGDRILLYTAPTDMHKSFRGSSALVYRYRGGPESGVYYVFVNRRRTHVKIFYWDGDGLALWYKRLEKGCFAVPPVRDGRIELDRCQLALLLEGVVPLKPNPCYRLSIVQSCRALGIEPFRYLDDVLRRIEGRPPPIASTNCFLTTGRPRPGTTAEPNLDPPTPEPSLHPADLSYKRHACIVPRRKMRAASADRTQTKPGLSWRLAQSGFASY
ncbi:MAG: IS66 family insertion sequence element accessory protein TnpB [Kiritimatiellaeota bacterium]|nr:IS66 family insertion sequence element accessory protein TnpB [Kiritimatiellota bacterium]